MEQDGKVGMRNYIRLFADLAVIGFVVLCVPLLFDYNNAKQVYLSTSYGKIFDGIRSDCRNSSTATIYLAKNKYDDWFNQTAIISGYSCRDESLDPTLKIYNYSEVVLNDTGLRRQDGRNNGSAAERLYCVLP